MNLRLYLSELEEGFEFEKAVCNHGFFMMAPNVWNPIRKTLSRPLTLANSSSVMVTISHPPIHPFIIIDVHGINNVREADEKLIFQQVRRMLRFTSKEERDVTKFHQLHEAAKESGFGRIFRSPSLFEDMVKSILLCNSTWERTLLMASRLYAMQSMLADRKTRSKKRKRDQEPKKEACGNFPSAKEIASLDKEFINEHCKLGYRAKWIIELATKVERKSLNLEEMEKGEMEPEQMHGKEECSKVTIVKEAQLFYNRYSSFQSLAYWFDLIQNYEAKHGKLSELSRSDYNRVGGCSYMNQLKAD
ncbi:unnamed protein product [Arabis nemorensis]|uniref:Uncharacterized protein n=1 Tax=Arabis nemorensis TaxID=586526 RepID=A0A565AWE7_9BRAS|nr:unnamed protein product [Arabis nemorensis]